MSRFALMTVVWGKSYVDDFVAYCLGSLLAPGNLPHLAKRRACRYRIYSSPPDAKAISETENCRRLRELMPVEFATISGINRVGKYRTMTQCHKDFIRSCVDEESAFTIVCPDVIWADGVFARVVELEARGVRMVLVSTPRLAKEGLLEEVGRRYGAKGRLGPIQPRELVEIASRHPHPVLAAQFEDPGLHPAAELGDFIWTVPSEGFLARHFQLQPLMLRPRTPAVPEVAIDADYLLAVGVPPQETYVVEDSDEICLFDFTSEHSGNPPQRPRKTAVDVATWAAAETHEVHRRLIASRIRFHWTDCSRDAWRAVEETSDLVIAEVLRAMDGADIAVPSPSPLRFLSPVYVGRKVRSYGLSAVASRLSDRLRTVTLSRLYGSEISIDVWPGPQ